MCLAVPAKITRLDESGHGTASIPGERGRGQFRLVPQAKPGDWVIIHAGFAISVMDEKEARETLRLFRDMAAADRR